MTNEILWTNVLETLSREINPISFNTWLNNTKLIALENQKAIIKVPMKCHKIMLTQTYYEPLSNALFNLTKKEYEFWRKTKYRDKAILILFLTYGLRISELQQLNLSSFNFNRGEFIIYRKRGKESVMPLNRTVTNAVRAYIEQERPKSDELDEEHKDALFLSLQGRRMTERQIRQMVKKYTSIGLSTSRDAGYSPHKLRATAATSLIGRGNSIYDVQALLDHENVTTTQLYAAHKKNVKRDLIKNFEWDEDE